MALLVNTSKHLKNNLSKEELITIFHKLFELDEASTTQIIFIL